MAFSNFTSGKLNRQGEEIWIANNTFQYLLTFILAQIVIMTQPNPNEKKVDDNKIQKTETTKDKIFKFLKLDNDICPLWIQIVIGALGVIASLLICLSLRNTSITQFAMIQNTICLVNLTISALTLERKFHACNQIGSILSFLAAITLTVQSSTNNEDASKSTYNVFLGNICVFLAVVMFSLQNVQLDHLSSKYDFDTFYFNRSMNFCAAAINFVAALQDDQLWNLCNLLGDNVFLQWQVVNALIDATQKFMIPHFIKLTSAGFFGLVCVLISVWTAIFDQFFNSFKTDMYETVFCVLIFSGAMLYNYGEYLLRQNNTSTEESVKVKDEKIMKDDKHVTEKLIK